MRCFRDLIALEFFADVCSGRWVRFWVFRFSCFVEGVCGGCLICDFPEFWRAWFVKVTLLDLFWVYLVSPIVPDVDLLFGIDRGDLVCDLCVLCLRGV